MDLDFPLKFYLVFRYRARDFYEKNAELKQAIDQINSGYFSPENPDLFHDVVNSLLGDNGDQ
jgi:glucan phosphorylase